MLGNEETTSSHMFINCGYKTVVAAKLERVTFYRGQIRSKDKIHISIGHQTVHATILALFRPLNRDSSSRV